MAKSTSSIVSILGLVMSIITNLVRRVEALGGSEEMVRQLANPDNPLIQQIAEMIVRNNRKELLVPHWLNICKALQQPKSDPEHRMAMKNVNAWLSTENDPSNEFSFVHMIGLQGLFPLFWSTSPTFGEKIPLSVISRIERDSMNGGVLEFGLHLAITDECSKNMNISLFERDASKYPIGSVLEYKGGRYVVTHNRNNSLDENIRDIILNPQNKVEVEL